MTLSIKRARLQEITDELRRLEKLEDAGGHHGESPEAHADHVRSLTREFDELERQIRIGAAFEAGQVESGDGALGAPQFQRDADPYAPRSMFETAQEVRGRATKAIERWTADDEIKQAATVMVERIDELSAPGVADHILRYGRPEYVEAFRKYARAQGRPEFVAELTPAEAAVWRINGEHQRSTLDLAGAVLPAPIDPTVVPTGDGNVNPLREISRVDQTTSNTKTYITSRGTTVSYDGELAQVSDDTPELDDLVITTRKGQGWIEASLEAAMDQPRFDLEMVRILEEARSDLDAAVLVNGTSGSNEPNGFVTQLINTTASVAPLTPEVFAAADVYNLLEELPPRFRANAVWGAEISTINQIDQFETTNGAKLFPEVGNTDPVLLRRRLFELSEMSPASMINVSSTGVHPILVVGDFQSNFIILDRLGTTVAFAGPATIMGDDKRPLGKVGAYMYWRMGSSITDWNAFRLLKIVTSGD